MNDKAERWLIAAHAFQSLMMIAMVFGFLGLRMAVGALFGHDQASGALPALTQWTLNWGPKDATSGWAFSLFCAATYMSLGLIAIARASSTAQALARCYALASVWLLSVLYLLVMLLSFALPLIPSIRRLQGDHSSVVPRVWLMLSVLYLVVLVVITRRLMKQKPQEGQHAAAPYSEPASRSPHG